MPPSQPPRLAESCQVTRAVRPSARSAARALLKYASLYLPARICSTGSANSDGSIRFRLRGGVVYRTATGGVGGGPVIASGFSARSSSSRVISLRSITSS
jgi:hypothetical protein